jgi:hypothetical protein
MAGIRKPVRWLESEAKRALRATRAAGLEVERLELSPDGEISVSPKASNAPESSDEWDEAIAKKPVPVR